MFFNAFPYYMAMGMSYEEYWNGPPYLVCAYRKAWEMKRKNDEWARWRQGDYFYNALLCAAPVLKPFVKESKPGKYPDQPWPLTEEEAAEQDEARERAGYEQALARRRAESDREKLRRAEAAEEQEA